MSQKSGICARPGCENPLNTGSLYCGRSCAALDRKRRAAHRRPAQVPSAVAAVLRSTLDAGDAEYVLSQMRSIDLENAHPSPPTAGRTQGGAYRRGINIPTPKRFHLGEHRPTDTLSYDDIEMMRKNGQVIFTLMLKKSPVRTVFRNDRSWHIESKDLVMADVITHNLNKILPRHMGDILTYLDYGTAFFELVWKNTTMKELGLRRSDSGNNVAVLKKLNAVYPATIEQILVKPNGSFNGFTQRVSGTKGPFVRVPTDQALIFTHDGYFRNKWGNSYLTAMFPFWYWYEVVWRLFLRYMERMATPVVVGKAPQTHKVVDSAGNLVDAMDKALEIAGDVGYSNAVAIPSDVDENGNALWVLEYLESPAGGENVFIHALEELGTMIIRSGLMADRVATQESSTGSYNMSSIHYIVTQLHNEWILDDIVYHLNEYLLWKYEYYNRGIRNSGTCMITEGLDIEEKTRLFQLLMKLSDSKHPDLERVDIEKALLISNIPVKSEEAFRKAQEEKLTRMVEVQEIMAKAKTFPQDDKDGGKTSDKEKAEQSLSAFTHSLATSRGSLPALVTEQTLSEMADRGIGIETGSYTKVFPGVTLESADAELTDEELEEVKAALLAALDLPGEISEESRAEIWRAILQYLATGDDLEYIAVPLPLLEELSDMVELGVGDWLRGIVKKAKRLIGGIIRKVTGTDKNWRKVVTKAYERGAKKDVAGAIITKDGRVWRPEDHPRDAAGRWAKKGERGKTDPEQVTPFTEKELAAIKHDLVTKQSLPEPLADAIVDIYAKGDPEVFGSAVSQFRVVTDEEAARRMGVPTEAAHDGWFGCYDDFHQDISLSTKLVLALTDPAQFAAEYPATITALQADNKYNEPLDLKRLAYSVIVHEMLHSTTRAGERKIKVVEKEYLKAGKHVVNARLINEEGLTDLLTAHHTAKILGEPKTSLYIAYDSSCNAVSRMLWIVFDGNREAAWNWIHQAHRNGSHIADFNDLIHKMASQYPSVYPRYEKNLNNKNRFPGYTTIAPPVREWIKEDIISSPPEALRRRYGWAGKGGITVINTNEIIDNFMQDTGMTWLVDEMEVDYVRSSGYE